MVALAYCIWRPVSHSTILYLSVAVIFLTSAIIIFRDRLRIPTWLFASTSCILIAAALGTAVGAFNTNPGNLQQAVQWLIAPVVWSAFAASITRSAVPLVLKVTVITLGICSLTMFLYVAPRLGLPATLPSVLSDQQGAGLNDHEGSTAFRWYGLSSLAAGAPLLVVAAAQHRDSWLPRRTVLVLSAVAATLVSFYSGRRAVLLVVLLALAILPLIRRQRSKRDAFLPALVALAATVAGGLCVFAQSFVATLVRPLVTGAEIYLGIADSSVLNADDAARADESRVLLDAFLHSPLWGHGLGALTPGFYRSEERPWTFELQLHLALMNLGVLGCALIAYALITWISVLRRVRRKAPEHSPSIDATAIGCVALAIADLTNPYLQAVGHGWGVALSVGLLCACSREPEDPQPGPFTAQPSAMRRTPRRPSRSKHHNWPKPRRSFPQGARAQHRRG